jgi:catechol 2,3-dioxygenase-like lactoylglutathione lyase family enzyme
MNATETIVTTLYARSVFFVNDAARSKRFYTEELGFSVDWDFNGGVFQVSLFGFELILNEVGPRTETRVGHGRVFIGLEDDQGEPLRKHIAERGIQTLRVDWGRPTLVVRDLDHNELFFWLPHDDFSDLGKPPIESRELTNPTA